VTNEVAAEEALRRAKEVAEDASRAKSSFLATMSHELRTPLNAIIGFSEIISNEMLGPAGVPEYRGYAEDIRESGGLLLSIIGEILEFSKLESGKINLSEEVLEVHEVVGSALMLVAKSAEKRGLTVKSDLPEKLPRLRADRIKIMQTLGNLLSNAIKFTEDGGTVSVRAAVAAGGAFVIEVRDDGIGIAEQDIPRALLPFEQVDNSLSRNYSGTGLGLPLSRTFTELHGGTFELSSTPGKGTTVTLTFPIERIVSD